MQGSFIFSPLLPFWLHSRPQAYNPLLVAATCEKTVLVVVFAVLEALFSSFFIYTSLYQPISKSFFLMCLMLARC